ncbi:hypothetical protein MKQ68_07870 [Chitinophaga horti]|uniref:Sortilin N-terminal domain-containing protein n=1 Tax=Chitinophaga horti TaxID=2920382 RepID=A0ABY6J5R2_9BACT|nr:hypothetical protein [Chitinophaga horti]UYQ95010.1 hypothetical protein MKQ68_07870 [Chitinophaga horti]
MRRCWLLILLSFTAFSTVTAQSGEDSLRTYFSKWSVTQLAEGGRIDAIRQLDKEAVLCAARGPNKGKLFISEDKGLSWRFLAQPVTADITCIAETGRRNEFYILTGTAEVWGTTDGGKTWTHLKTLLPHNRNRQQYAASYAIMYTHQGTLLVTDTDSEGGHIYRSADKGKTWQDIGAISHNSLYRLERTGNGIVVNGWQGAVYKSIDDGITWNKMQQLTDTALFATEYMGMSVVLQADQSGKIFRSRNLGYEWDSVAHLTGSADDFVNIGYGAAYYSTYTEKKEVYLTTDYGKTWRSLGKIPTVENDWLDHGVRLETADSIITLSGTHKGFMLRTAFHKSSLARDLDQWNNNQTHIAPSKRTDIPQEAIAGQLVDVEALNEPEDILVHRNFAYIPCRDGNNVAIIDVRNPVKPLLAFNLKDPDILDAFSVAIENDHLFVLSMTNAMVSVYRISDPRKPKKVAAIKVGGEGSYLQMYRSNYTRLRKIVVQDGYAYVTHSSESKVYILDVKRPAAPVIVSSFHTGDGAFAALVHQNTLYLAGYGPGSSLITVDIRDKKNPVITDRIYDPVKLKGTCALAKRGEYLYVTAYNAETVWSFSIQDPLHPKVVQMLSDTDMRGPGRIAFYKDRGFVLNSVNNSVAVIHTDDGGRMKIETFLQHPLLKRVYGIAVVDHWVMLAGREAKSFIVVDIDKLGRWLEARSRRE